MIEYFWSLLARNHDLQVRFKWKKDDLAIWDNRCVYHAATYEMSGLTKITSSFDYDELRIGNRTVGIGEKPFFNSNSKSKKDALASTGVA